MEQPVAPERDFTASFSETEPACQGLFTSWGAFSFNSRGKSLSPFTNQKQTVISKYAKVLFIYIK